MKLASFSQGGITRLGVVEGTRVRELSFAAGRPVDMAELLGDQELLQKARSARGGAEFELDAVRLEAPIARPRKFLGLGASYRAHAAEMSRLIAAPQGQIWFNKQVTSVNAPYGDVHLPHGTDTLDYEGELALVIGRKGRRVKGAAARELIAGFMICNDFSVREWQRRSPTHTLGKSFDTHGPIGPWVVTADELDATNLELRTWVNGELRQSGNTRDLIWTFSEMLEELSFVFTLEPGDILTTGTPAGVGAGRTPPSFLRPGDVVRVEIAGIGHIENRIVSEP